jgi:hypothetical protein
MMIRRKETLLASARNALRTAPIHQEKRQPDLTFLENDIIDAANMAYVATDLLEHNLSQQDTTLRSQSLYYLPEDDVEAMFFAAYQTHQMLVRLRDRYLGAIES